MTSHTAAAAFGADPAGDAAHAPSADALAAAVAPPSHSAIIASKISRASFPNPLAAHALSARSNHGVVDASADACGDARAAHHVSTSRFPAPCLSHALAIVAYDAMGRSARTPPARATSDATRASRAASSASFSALAARSSRADLPATSAAAVNAGGGASSASFASFSAASARVLAACASLAARAVALASALNPPTTSIAFFHAPPFSKAASACVTIDAVGSMPSFIARCQTATASATNPPPAHALSALAITAASGSIFIALYASIAA
mmetsp:Transcript_8463/g.30964  ORF Transcript_8463/g.30964 Transcript_8463/m.30964 type:complete len:268 (-) Transcript_8463:1128-1931(-)